MTALAAQKLSPEAEAGLVAIIEKALEAKLGKGSPLAFQKAALYPDQAELDERDPLKGKGIGVVRWMKAAQHAKSKGISVEQAAIDLGDTKTAELVKMGAERIKALAGQTQVDGGALVPLEYAADFLPLLRNATVVLESGARVMSMKALSLVVGRQNAPGSASYVGENYITPTSQQQFGQLVLMLRKLAALTAVSNDLLRFGGVDAEAKVRDDLVAVMGLVFDITALRSAGGQYSPKGLRYLTNATNIFAATQGGAAATFQEIANDLAKAKRLIKAANVPLVGLGWVISPRIEQYLTSVASSLGVFPFKDEMFAKGTIWGIPYKVTAAIPENLGGSSNESEVYLCAWPQYLIGMGLGLTIEMFQNGTALDNGVMTSGISSDLSWVRALMQHDDALAYDKACVVITTCKWGA